MATIPVPGADAPSTVAGRLEDLRRVAGYARRRLLSLFLTVLVGVYLTILIANMGGRVDDLRMVQIRSVAFETVRADPDFADLPDAERNELIERRIALNAALPITGRF